MNLRFLRLFVVSVLLGTFFGCSPDSSKNIPLLVQKKQRTSVNLTFSGKVDILIVIDNSFSMAGHQVNLMTNAKLFIDQISKNRLLDYHIGVITTDREEGRGELFGRVPVVDRNTPLTELQYNMRPGIDGSGSEKIFDPIQLALTEPNLSHANKGFYRDDAFLAIMVITDAEDHSTGYNAESLSQFLNGLKEVGNKVLTFGVFSFPGDTTCPKDESDVDPLSLVDFFNRTNGLTFSLCAPDYGARLAETGKVIERRVGRWIPFPTRPVISTIELKYGDQIIPNDIEKGWVYDPSQNGVYMGEHVEFEDAPEGTQLEVFYDPYVNI